MYLNRENGKENGESEGIGSEDFITIFGLVWLGLEDQTRKSNIFGYRESFRVVGFICGYLQGLLLWCSLLSNHILTRGELSWISPLINSLEKKSFPLYGSYVWVAPEFCATFHFDNRIIIFCTLTFQFCSNCDK